jgi:sugar O-acyltransferase (sialic acid O-acetyltransferase NeuD family)
VDRRIVIIGAGDHGRGVLEILRAASQNGERHEVIGFVDDAPEKLGTSIGGLPILGGLSWIRWCRDSEIGYVIAIAGTRAKQQILQRLGEQSLTWISAIHPSVILAAGVRVAQGAVMNAGVVVAYDTLIGAHSTINLNATIGHDCVVERFSTVAPGANIAGRVRVGEGCDVGMNATVAAGISLGEWSSIGLGSVIMRNVGAGEHAFGNPARLVPLRTHA